MKFLPALNSAGVEILLGCEASRSLRCIHLNHWLNGLIDAPLQYAEATTRKKRCRVMYAYMSCIRKACVCLLCLLPNLTTAMQK